jgi:hypothetical protein
VAVRVPQFETTLAVVAVAQRRRKLYTTGFDMPGDRVLGTLTIGYDATGNFIIGDRIFDQFRRNSAGGSKEGERSQWPKATLPFGRVGDTISQ